MVSRNPNLTNWCKFYGDINILTKSSRRVCGTQRFFMLRVFNFYQFKFNIILKFFVYINNKISSHGKPNFNVYGVNSMYLSPLDGPCALDTDISPIIFLKHNFDEVYVVSILYSWVYIWINSSRRHIMTCFQNIWVKKRKFNSFF